MSTPAVTEPTPDPIDELDAPVSDAEIAAAAKDEARAAEKSAAAEPRRGPGRPKGSKTRPKAQRSATKRGASTPIVPAAAQRASAPPVDEMERARRAAEKAKIEATAAMCQTWMTENRNQLVAAIGLVSGIPQNFLIGAQPDPKHPTEPLTDDAGKPVLTLTHYGAALAPADWQISVTAKAAAYAVETEEGQRLLEMFDKLMPYLFGAGALGALGVYTFTTMQAIKNIKPMIAIEIEQARVHAEAEAARQQQGQPPQSPGDPAGSG